MNNEINQTTNLVEFSAIFTAFAEAQAVLSNPVKDSKGYNYKYSSLDQIINILRNVLPTYGLGYTQNLQHVEDDGGQPMIAVETIVFHKSGQQLQPSYFTMPVEEGRGMSQAQSYGATITYARRYALSAIFCLASEDDTDLKDQKDANTDLRDRIEKMIKECGAEAYARSKKIDPRKTSIDTLKEIDKLSKEEIIKRVKAFEERKVA